MNDYKPLLFNDFNKLEKTGGLNFILTVCIYLCIAEKDIIVGSVDLASIIVIIPSFFYFFSQYNTIQYNTKTNIIIVASTP